MAESEPVDRPHPKIRPDTAAGPPRDPLPPDPLPTDGPVPHLSGGGPSLVDEPPDEDSALGEGEVRDGPKDAA